MMRKDFLSNQNKNVVDVLFSFNGQEQYARPVRLTWQDENYELEGVQFWYVERRGNTAVHHYTVGDSEGSYTFRLALETENLTWKLEKASKTKNTLRVGLEPFVGATA